MTLQNLHFSSNYWQKIASHLFVQRKTSISEQEMSSCAQSVGIRNPEVLGAMQDIVFKKSSIQGLMSHPNICLSLGTFSLLSMKMERMLLKRRQEFCTDVA